MLFHPALISLRIRLHLLSPPSKLTLYSVPHWESQGILPSRHGRQAIVPNHSPPHQPHCLLYPPPLLPIPPSLPPPQWLKLTFQREGEAGWGDESAVLRLASLTLLPGRLWLAPGLVQGTCREAHNCELCLCLALNVCVVSLLIFTHGGMFG